MKKALFGVALVLFMGAFNPVFGDEGTQEKVYKKGIFSLSYPDSGWKLEELGSQPGKKDTTVKIIAEGTPALSVIVNWDDSMGPLSEKDKQTRSAVAAGAFGLPIALKMADKKEENISFSVGSLNVANYVDLGAKYVIRKPGTLQNTSIDAFAYFPEEVPGNIVVGAVISEGSQLQSDLKDSYYDRLSDAYAIVQSIELKSKG